MAIVAPDDVDDDAPVPIDDDLDGIISVSHKAAPERPKRKTPHLPRGPGAKAKAAPEPIVAPPVVGVPPAPAPPPVPLPPPPVEPPVVEPVEEDPIVSVPCPPAPVEPKSPPRPRVPGDWFDGPFGAKVSYKEYEDRKRGTAYSEWKIKCNQPGHPTSCMKQRSISAAHTAQAGDIEPLAYVHTWLDTPAREGKTHAGTDPKNEDVVAFANAHGEALAPLLARRP